MIAGGANSLPARVSAEREAHKRRRIVEQHDHRAFAGRAILVGHVGIKIRAGERRSRIGALARGSGTQPLQKLTDNHSLNTNATRIGPTAHSIRLSAPP